MDQAVSSTSTHDSQICRSVLVVDDNSGVREALITKIVSSGFEAKGARSGEEAIQVLPTLQAPTLVFLDLMMPRLNGWELMEIWRQDPKLRKNQIVLISAVNQKSRPDKNPISHIAGSILKPLSVKAVMSYVNQFCLTNFQAVDSEPNRALSTGPAVSGKDSGHAPKPSERIL